MTSSHRPFMILFVLNCVTKRSTKPNELFELHTLSAKQFSSEISLSINLDWSSIATKGNGVHGISESRTVVCASVGRDAETIIEC